MKVMFNIISFLLFASFYPVKQENKDIIIWSKERKLTWNDFKASPKNRTGSIAALSSTGVEFLSINNNKCYNCYFVSIHAYFNKKESWTKTNSVSHLKHEQGHFDIAEIYARKLRKKITHHKFKKKSLSLTLNELINHNKNELICFQKLYDKETQHSLDKKKQNQWNKKIEEELKSLEIYSNPVIKIKYK